jgi:hypothetical protein
MSWPLAAVLFAWLGLNGLASVAVLRNQSLPATKRLLQLALVWLLPVIGAVICLAFVLSDARERATDLDRTAFIDNADASGQPVDMAPGSSICGCVGSDSGGGDGGGGD